ncbi:MAG: toll/interleukin-1 receptor domain-containing protein, partial [Chloroflexota bacterium]
MPDVFISYSRKDSEFVHHLFDSLTAAQRSAWVDWEGIPITAEWWSEIARGIEAADSFLFVISPDSVLSPVCNREIEHAVQNNKRLIPIVRRDAMGETVNKALASHNWLF